MAFVRTSDGTSVYAEAHGDGLPVVFTTGFCQTTENFRSQIEPLVAAGYRVVLWDLRGHGRSGVPTSDEGFACARIVEDLLEVLDWAAPGQPAVACGLSFGGLVSQHLALAHPERVAGLVLIASGPGFRKPEEQSRWEAMVERIAARIESEGLVGYTSGPGGRDSIGRHPELPAAKGAAVAIEAMTPDAVARLGRLAVGPAPATLDRLAEITQPALVLVGELDRPFRRAAEVMAAKLPNARHVVIPDAGHCMNIERPEAFHGAVLDFLASLDQ